MWPPHSRRPPPSSQCIRPPAPHRRALHAARGRLLLQAALHSLGDPFCLVAMPYQPADVDDQSEDLKAEIERRADAVRAASDAYIHDDDIYTRVPLVRRTAPPDHIEAVGGRRRIGLGHKSQRHLLAEALAGAQPSADAASGHGGAASAGASGGATPGAGIGGDAPAAANASAANEPSIRPTAQPGPSPPPSPPEASLQSSLLLPVPDDGGHIRSRTRAATRRFKALQARSHASGLGLDQEGGGVGGGDSSEHALAAGGGGSTGLHWGWGRGRRGEGGASGGQLAGAGHDRMPCWKQYFVLFIGSLIVAASTITVVTLFAILPPITQYFVMFSFAGSVPTALVLHFTTRSVVRYLRKHLALRRGRQVEGVVQQTAVEAAAAARRRSTDVNQSIDVDRSNDGKRARLSLRGSAASPKPRLTSRLTSHLTSRLTSRATSRTTSREEGAEGGGGGGGGPRESTTSASSPLRNDISAHIASSVLDATKALAERRRLSGVARRHSFKLEDPATLQSAAAASLPVPPLAIGHPPTARASLRRPRKLSVDRGRKGSVDRASVGGVGRAASRGEALGRATAIIDANAGKALPLPESSIKPRDSKHDSKRDSKRDSSRNSGGGVASSSVPRPAPSAPRVLADSGPASGRGAVPERV